MMLVQRLHDWLGKAGRRLFTDLHQEYGDAFGAKIPHPVHSREGRQVRNWLRKQKECQGWTQERLDNEWSKLVLEAIQGRQRKTFFERLKNS